MERTLRLAGYVIAALLSPVAIVFLVTPLVLGVVPSTLSVPKTIADELAAEDFYNRVAVSAVESVLDRIPETIEIGGREVEVQAVIEVLQSRDLETIARAAIPRAWVEAQISALLAQLLGSTAEQVADITGQIDAEAAADIAGLVISTARECTDAEMDRLAELVNADEFVLPGFICNPPEISGEAVEALMQDAVIVILGEIIERIQTEVNALLADFDLSEIKVDTPAGAVSLAWPTVQLANGPLTLVYLLPENVQTAVETPILEMQAAVDSALAAAEARVAESQANLESARDAVNEALNTPRPEATAESTAEAATEATAEAAAPENTPEATAAAEAPPLPNATPVGVAVEAALRDASDSVNMAIQDAANALDQEAGPLSAAVGQTLLVSFGIPLLLLTVFVLFMVRTLRALGLWSGAVLAVGGLVLVIVSLVLSNVVNALLRPQNAVALQAVLVNAIANGIQTQMSTPLLVRGLVLFVVGAAFLGVVFWSWRQQWRAKSA